MLQRYIDLNPLLDSITSNEEYYLTAKLAKQAYHTIVISPYFLHLYFSQFSMKFFLETLIETRYLFPYPRL